MFERILLAVDEGGQADEAIRAVAALAGAFSSEVLVFHLRERTVTPGATIEKETIPESFAFGEAVAARLAADGVSVSAEIDGTEPGELAGRIVAKAGEIDARLIVLGGHHPHTLRERLFGDVARTVTHDAPCPVLLMPNVPPATTRVRPG